MSKLKVRFSSPTPPTSCFCKFFSANILYWICTNLYDKNLNLYEFIFEGIREFKWGDYRNVSPAPSSPKLTIYIKFLCSYLVRNSYEFVRPFPTFFENSLQPKNAFPHMPFPQPSNHQTKNTLNRKIPLPLLSTEFVRDCTTVPDIPAKCGNFY